MLKILKRNLFLAIFFASAIVVLGISVVAGRMMMSSAGLVEESVKKEMLALSEAAAMLTTPEELAQFTTPADMDKPEYNALKHRLDEFTRRADITFTYYMRLDPETDKMQYVVDNVLDPEEADGLLSKQVAREDGPNAAMTGTANAVDLGSYSEGWDGLLTAWAPMYYQDGRIANVVAGVDMHDVYIKAMRSNMRTMSAVLITALLAVLLSCLLCLRLYRYEARQAKIANEAKSMFLSQMSHEMRTPMNAIMGFCAMALEAKDGNDVKNYLNNINIASQHLRHVIDDVLDLSKIESGKMVLEFSAVNLRAELDYIFSLLRPQMDAQQHSFTLQVSPDVPEAVYCDNTHVRQVVINLLSNAVKFTPKNGTISLTVSVLNYENDICNLEWRVKDNGIGIDAEGRRRIFSAFEQIDASNTRKYGGTGLGLSIAKRLVEMMHGHIRVDSEPGRGSEFIFNLPMRLANPETVRKNKALTASTKDLDLSGKRILLVEDAEMNQLIADFFA